MRRPLIVIFLLVLVCFCMTLFTDWYGGYPGKSKDIVSAPNNASRRESLAKVEVVTSSHPFPLPNADANTGASTSWNTVRQFHHSANKIGNETTQLKLTPVWKAPSKGGHSAPVVFGDYGVLSSGGSAGVQVTAYELTTGTEAWSKSLSDQPVATKHVKGSAVSSTPALAYNSLIVCWSDAEDVWMVRLAADGNELWRYRVGPANSQWGFNASPVPYRGLVFLNVDNQFSGFVVAVHVETGELVWRQTRPEGYEGSYSSPLIISDEAGDAVLVLSGLQCVVGLNAASGQPLWTLPAVSDVSAATPIYDNGFLVASSGFRQHHIITLEFKNGHQRVPQPVWAASKPSEVPYVPTPVMKDGKLYVVQDDGIAQAIDLRSGKPIWKKRLGFAVTASPTWIDRVVLVCGENGRCLTLEPTSGDTLLEVDVQEPIFASPTLAAGRLLLRTKANLHCFDLSSDEVP